MATTGVAGTEASMWAHRPNDNPSASSRDWLRDRETGSARGLPRGRGRGGRAKPNVRGGGRPPPVRDSPEKKSELRRNDAIVDENRKTISSPHVNQPSLSSPILDKPSLSGSTENRGQGKGRPRRIL